MKHTLLATTLLLIAPTVYCESNMKTTMRMHSIDQQRKKVCHLQRMMLYRLLSDINEANDLADVANVGLISKVLVLLTELISNLDALTNHVMILQDIVENQLAQADLDLPEETGVEFPSSQSIVDKIQGLLAELQKELSALSIL